MANNCIKDMLANLSLSQNPNDLTEETKAYYKGLIVGAVSTVMGLNNCLFQDAVEIVKSHFPNDCIDLYEILPEYWVEDFEPIQESNDGL